MTPFGHNRDKVRTLLTPVLPTPLNGSQCFDRSQLSSKCKSNGTEIYKTTIRVLLSMGGTHNLSKNSRHWIEPFGQHFPLYPQIQVPPFRLGPCPTTRCIGSTRIEEDSLVEGGGGE